MYRRDAAYTWTFFVRWRTYCGRLFVGSRDCVQRGSCPLRGFIYIPYYSNRNRLGTFTRVRRHRTFDDNSTNSFAPTVHGDTFCHRSLQRINNFRFFRKSRADPKTIENPIVTEPSSYGTPIVYYTVSRTTRHVRISSKVHSTVSRLKRLYKFAEYNLSPPNYGNGVHKYPITRDLLRLIIFLYGYFFVRWWNVYYLRYPL